MNPNQQKKMIRIFASIMAVMMIFSIVAQFVMYLQM